MSRQKAKYSKRKPQQKAATASECEEIEKVSEVGGAEFDVSWIENNIKLIE